MNSEAEGDWLNACGYQYRLSILIKSQFPSILVEVLTSVNVYC